MGMVKGTTPAPIKPSSERLQEFPHLRNPIRQLKRTDSVRGSGRSRFRRETDAERGRKRAHKPWYAGRIDEIATLFHAWKRGQPRPEPEDLRTPVYSAPQVKLNLFLLDVSDSMAETRQLARAWAEKFLNESYLRRDPVGIVAVQGTSAKVLVQPTTSLPFILHHLASLEESGGTPLRQGIQLAERLIRQWHDRYQAIDLYVLTDGRSTEPLEGPEFAKSLSMIHKFTREILVVNPAPKAAPFARSFAALIGARYLDPRAFLHSATPPG